MRHTQYIEPLLRADFRMLETYRYVPKGDDEDPRLPCPIAACFAHGDLRCEGDLAEVSS